MSAAPIEPQAVDQVQAQSADDKHFSHMAARAALASCGLYRLADGRYLLTRTSWGMCRELGSLHEVGAVLGQMGQ